MDERFKTKPLRRPRTTERPEQRPDPRPERPRRDSQAHHQERLSHRPAGPGRRRTSTPIDAGETDAGETSAHRIEGEADPLLVVTDGGEAQPSEPDRGPWVSPRGSAYVARGSAYVVSLPRVR